MQNALHHTSTPHVGCEYELRRPDSSEWTYVGTSLDCIASAEMHSKRVTTSNALIVEHREWSMKILNVHKATMTTVQFMRLLQKKRRKRSRSGEAWC